MAEATAAAMAATMTVVRGSNSGSKGQGRAATCSDNGGNKGQQWRKRGAATVAARGSNGGCNSSSNEDSKGQ